MVENNKCNVIVENITCIFYLSFRRDATARLRRKPISSRYV